MNIHDIVRAVTILEQVAHKYEINPAVMLCIVADFQSTLIDQELDSAQQPRPPHSADLARPVPEAGRDFSETPDWRRDEITRKYNDEHRNERSERDRYADSVSWRRNL